MLTWAAVYLFWNAIAFFRMGADKRYAKTGKRRIPERIFFLWAALFGAAGVWAGMFFFRHKTCHLSFRMGIPVLFMLNIGMIGLLYIKI